MYESLHLDFKHVAIPRLVCCIDASWSTELLVCHYSHAPALLEVRCPTPGAPVGCGAPPTWLYRMSLQGEHSAASCTVIEEALCKGMIIAVTTAVLTNLLCIAICEELQWKPSCLLLDFNLTFCVSRISLDSRLD